MFRVRLGAPRRPAAGVVEPLGAPPWTSDYALLEGDDQVVGRFSTNYHTIWQKHFPGLIKRAHWHVIFSARCGLDQGVSCRSIHRTLYGSYGTDIRTCVERVKDCEQGRSFVQVIDPNGKPCAASAGSFFVGTDKLRQNFDRHAI